MSKEKVLFVNQEIMPYIPESEMSKAGIDLPKGIQERGYEVRTFMPKYGCINERRNQLHEVIRLSGMNLINRRYRPSANHQSGNLAAGAHAGLFHLQRRLFPAQSRKRT